MGPLDPAVVNGKRVDFHVFDTPGSIACDATVVDPTAPTYQKKDEAVLVREVEKGKVLKHVFTGDTMVPLAMSTFGKLGPAAEGYLQTLANVACSTGAVLTVVFGYVCLDRCLAARWRGFVFRHDYRSLAKSAGKDFRNGAAVPFE